MASENIWCRRRGHDQWVSEARLHMSWLVERSSFSANLNKSYFTNRQDRYIHFGGHSSALAQYCFDFVEASSSFSYKLAPAMESDTSSSVLGPHSYQQDDFTVNWPDPYTHPHHIHKKAEAALSKLQAGRVSAQNESGGNIASDEVLLFPMIQGGQFNIREEESVLESLFRTLSSRNAESKTDSIGPPLMDLTSGYFGLYRPYQDLVLGCEDIHCRIIASSPKVRHLSAVLDLVINLCYSNRPMASMGLVDYPVTYPRVTRYSNNGL